MKIFNKVIEEVTQGLSKDRELRRDVSLELESHLLDTYEAILESGASEEEAYQEALKVFGPIDEISTSLIEANKKKMKTRALILTMAQKVLMPAAILLILWTLFIHWNRIHTLNDLTSFLGGTQSSDEDHLLNSINYDKKALFYLYGDLSRKTKADQIKAIWESDPNNKVYYAYYVSHLISENEANSTDIEKALIKGLEIDPQNARYNYLLACYHIENSIDEEETESGTNFYITDINQFKKGIRLYKDSIPKEYYRTWNQEMVEEINSHLPEISKTEDMIARISFHASILLPDLSKIRSLSQHYIPLWIKHLEKEKISEQIPPLLSSWHDIATKVNNHSSYLIECLVAKSIISNAKEIYLPHYEKVHPEKSKNILAKIQLFNKLDKNIKHAPSEEIISQHGGILSNLLLPALSNVDPQATFPSKHLFKAERKIEFSLVEQSVLIVVLIFFLFLFFFTFLSILIHRKASSPLSPNIFVPTAKTFFIVLLYSSILPTIGYYFYTRLTLLSGRDYSFLFLASRFSSEILIVISCMLFLGFYISTHFILRRCQQLNINAPNFKLPKKYLIYPGIILWLLLTQINENSSENLKYSLLTISALGTIIAFFHIAFFFFKSIFHRGKYQTFYLCHAKSLQIFMLAGPITLCLLAFPYLRHEESKYLKESHIAPSTSITDYETKVTQSLQKKQKELLSNFQI